MRKLIPLNQNWLFQKGSEEPISVNLPHTYNAVDGQDGSPMYRGEAVYTKTWTLTEEEAVRTHYLEVGASALSSEIFINGKLLYNTHCGYALYRVPMDEALMIGENTIEIHVTNGSDPTVYPAMADFSFYGGVYREVRIVSDESIHFHETDESRDGIYILPEVKEDGSGMLTVTASVTRESSCPLSDVCCVLRVETPSGEVAAFETLPLSADSLKFQLSIPSVHLWNGISDPYLYTVVLSLTDADGICYDSRRLETGFRTYSFTPEEGFLLNGKPYKLHGVARHQDFGGIGNAITRKEMENDLSLILEVGANAVRCSHYQHADEWYTYCDRAGLVVWAEVPVISAVAQKKAADQNAFDQLRKLILQARNHCCIFCWGVQNEVCMMTKNPYTFDLVERLSKFAKEMDPYRMTAQANEYTTEDDCPITYSTDIMGHNLYYGWYYGVIADLQDRLDNIHQVHPETPIILTEYGVDTNPRFHSLTPKVSDYTEEYQLAFCSNAIQAVEERSWMAGSFIWVMFDFGSAGRDEGGTKGKNQKGLITIDRKTKKDAFYLYKAHWSKEPFVYLAGRRFVNRPQKETDITVLGNLSRIQLFVNGAVFAEKTDAEAMTVIPSVPLLPGENTIRVLGWTKDGACYSDEILICSVKEADPSYVLPKKKEEKTAVNWFLNVDPETTKVYEKKPLRKEGFTLDSNVGDIFRNPAAKEIFMKYLKPLTENSRFESSKDFMSVSRLVNISRAGVPEQILDILEQELNEIDAPVEE